MDTYSLYEDIPISFTFSTAPDSGSVFSKISYEWGDLVSTIGPVDSDEEAPTVFATEIPGDLIEAAGVYEVKWSADFDEQTKFFSQSFIVEEQYVTESEFFDRYPDMDLPEYQGESFKRAELVARKIVDTFCGQNFQFVGNKKMSKEGNGRNTMHLGRRIASLNSVSISIDSTFEDVSGEVEVDWQSKYSIKSTRKFPDNYRVDIYANWGWTSIPSNIKEATALLAADLLEEAKREHYRYGIVRLEQDTNRFEFNRAILTESTGNLDVDVLIMDYVYWVPDWI
jgi:hypothetical protein